MTVLLGFAFVSGLVTVLSPCILPVLPIVLSGGVGRGKARPYGVLAGFVGSFTLFTLTLTAIVQSIGIPADTLRYIAVGMIVLLGVVMIVPGLRVRFEVLVSRISALGGRRKADVGDAGSGAIGSGNTKVRAAGFFQGLPVGLSLGLVWTPCVGPIMASVISLALTRQVNGGAVFITIAYTLGTSIPMLAIMLGGKTLLTRVPALSRHAAGIQRGFGVVMVLVGVAIGFGWDRQFQTAILTALPRYGAGLTAIEDQEPVRAALDQWEFGALPGRDSAEGSASDPESMVRTISAANRPEGGETSDYGEAPAIVAQGPWFNTEGISPADSTGAGAGALSMDDLAGKVVVLDFWTYSCVNCVRTIPHLRSWYETYKDAGLVILGVHTPEFEFEKNPVNVERAIQELGITWPVVLDNNYAQWRSYSNRYWPAHYFIDATGRVRYYQFGEGRYDTAEMVIRELLAEAGATNLGRIASVPSQDYAARTPETYLGFGRQENLKNVGELVRNEVSEFHRAGEPGNGEWTLDGRWNVNREYVVPESAGVLELGFNARNVFLVIEPDGSGRVKVSVDGKVSRDTADVKDGVLLAGESRLYQLVGLRRAGEHVLRLEVEGNLRLFAFTFG